MNPYVSPSPCVHMVDDEAAVRDALTFLMRSHGLSVSSYASGPEFLSHLALQPVRGCIVLDVRMEPLSGLQVFDELRLRGVTLPVLFLSGHGDIPMVVDALQKGAVDFLEKPFSGDHLVQRVERALGMEAEQFATTTEQALTLRRLRALTSRERAVMRLVAAGKLNKVIADELCIAVRTVEAHRSRVFEKLQLRSAAELATLLAGVPENLSDK